MRFTQTEENYIKTIFHLQRQHGKVGTSLLSETMKIKPASVTDMLKKLELKKTLHYQKYHGFELTEGGNRKALNIIRKHRLWEYFLVEKLGFHWDEVHAMAEELEHVTSEVLTSRLDAFLNFPAFDPHGDPIPDGKGRMKSIRQDHLGNLPLKKILVVTAVKNQEASMLELLNHYTIRIGTRLKILQRFPYDGSVEIKIDKKPTFIIGGQVAQFIYCSI